MTPVQAHHLGCEVEYKTATMKNIESLGKFAQAVGPYLDVLHDSIFVDKRPDREIVEMLRDLFRKLEDV